MTKITNYMKTSTIIDHLITRLENIKNCSANTCRASAINHLKEAQMNIKIMEEVSNAKKET